MAKNPVSMLRNFRWLYDRRVTTLAVLVVALVGSLVAWALLPRAWRPNSMVWVLPAALAAYTVMRVDVRVGWSKRFKHSVMDWFGGDVDDAQTWGLAVLSAGVALVMVALAQRAG